MTGVQTCALPILRRSTNAQTFRVYNTYTSSTSHEYLKFSWATNVAEIGTVKGSGGGSARDLVIKTDDTERLRFASTGLMTVADAHDIAVGSTTGTKLGTNATQKLGFWNATPIVQNTGWSTSNSSSRKTIDATSTNVNELIDLVCTLIETLKSYGIIGA